MIHHPAQSLFIGCFPMGAATLINSALVSTPGLYVQVIRAHKFAEHQSGLGFRWERLPLDALGILVARLRCLLHHRLWHAIRHVSLSPYSSPFCAPWRAVMFCSVFRRGELGSGALSATFGQHTSVLTQHTAHRGDMNPIIRASTAGRTLCAYPIMMLSSTPSTLVMS